MKETSFGLSYSISLSDTRVVLGKFKNVIKILFFFQSFLDFKLTSKVVNSFIWSFNGFEEKFEKKHEVV